MRKLQMIGGRIANLFWIAIALTMLGGCGKADQNRKAVEETNNLKRLKEALPDAQVVPSDPEQIAKLGPAAVPGILPESALTALRIKALSGDGEAAYQLFHHYNLTGRDAEAQVWTRIGAENGEYNSMILMGFESEQTNSVEGCVRAVYWFTRARGELEADLKSPATAANKGDIEALIAAANKEIGDVRRRTAGC